VQSVSGDAALLITRDCPLHAMDGWDWEKHVTLMLEAECRFGVRFTVSEMAYVTNVGELVDLIYSNQV
jgi:acyl carrier protein